MIKLIYFILFYFILYSNPIKFGIKFPTKVVFYLNRQDKNGLLNCHEVKNGFIKFLLQVTFYFFIFLFIYLFI